MCVSFSGVGGVHPGFHKHVTGALDVFSWDVFCLHHGESQLIFLDRLGSNIPHFRGFTTTVIFRVFGFIDVDPAENSALSEACTGMVELPVFDWLVLDCSPFGAVQPVVEIDYGLADQVISEHIIIVICLDLQW